MANEKLNTSSNLKKQNSTLEEIVDGHSSRLKELERKFKGVEYFVDRLDEAVDRDTVIDLINEARPCKCQNTKYSISSDSDSDSTTSLSSDSDSVKIYNVKRPKKQAKVKNRTRKKKNYYVGQLMNYPYVTVNIEK